jgi:hypothetical protein
MTTKTDINIGANTANIGVFQTCVTEAFVFFQTYVAEGIWCIFDMINRNIYMLYI